MGVNHGVHNEFDELKTELTRDILELHIAVKGIKSRLDDIHNNTENLLDELNTRPQYTSFAKETLDVLETISKNLKSLRG